MLMTEIRRYAAIILLIAAFTVFSACSEKTVFNKGDGTVVFVVGSAAALNPAGNSRHLNLKDILTKTDKIITGEKTVLVIQIISDLLRISENTAISFDEINTSHKTAVQLNDGTVFAKVLKKQPERQFYVKTPVAVISVRGTEFSVSHSEKDGTYVSVKEGQVSITGLKNEMKVQPGEVILGPGESAFIQDEIVRKNASRVDLLNLKKISVFPVIGADALNRIPLKELENVNEKHKASEEEIDRDINKTGDKKKLTLDEIRLKYGKLEVVTLYNGTVYRGAIVSRGELITIHTTSGFQKIVFKKIKSINQLK